jgi:DNA/RNA endonuclease YhcR with UshA esterase domain
MNYRHLLLLLALITLPLTSACNIGPGGDDDDTTDDDDDTLDPVEVTIAELKADAVVPGMPVILANVVVTSPFKLPYNEDNTESYFWVQDGSGPNTGMTIFTYRDIAEALEDSVEPGDIVTISGNFDVFDGSDEVKLFAIEDIEVTGSTDVPLAYGVAEADIANGFADDSLDAVLIRLEDTTVGEAPGYDNYFDWTTEGGAIVDGDFIIPDVVAGYTIDNLTGVLAKSFGNMVVFPRWASDVDFTHTGCGDAGTGALVSLNCGDTAIDDDVTATLIVTSPEPFFGGAFFAQVEGGGDFTGVQVYGAGDFSQPAIGDIVTVTGEYEEYKGQSEIVIFGNDDISVDSSGSAVTALSVTDPCTLGEAHEGRLVTVPSLVVTQDSDGANYGYYSVEGCPLIQVNATFFSDTDAFATATGGPGTITNLTGVVVDKYDVYAIAPRGETDWDSWVQ